MYESQTLVPLKATSPEIATGKNNSQVDIPRLAIDKDEKNKKKVEKILKTQKS
jgi:hypothetical protein